MRVDKLLVVLLVVAFAGASCSKTKVEFFGNDKNGVESEAFDYSKCFDCQQCPDFRGKAEVWISSESFTLKVDTHSLVVNHLTDINEFCAKKTFVSDEALLGDVWRHTEKFNLWFKNKRQLVTVTASYSYMFHGNRKINDVDLPAIDLKDIEYHVLGAADVFAAKSAYLNDCPYLWYGREFLFFVKIGKEEIERSLSLEFLQQNGGCKEVMPEPISAPKLKVKKPVTKRVSKPCPPCPPGPPAVQPMVDPAGMTDTQTLLIF